MIGGADSAPPPFQLPRVIILIESLYDELSAAVEGEGGAQINDSREPGCLPAANGSQSKEGASQSQEG